MMFQDPYASLDPRMRVGAILREPLLIQQIGSAAEQRQRVAELLDEVGLSPRSIQLLPARVLRRPAAADRPGPGARARPKLIVADEPVSALDVSIRSQILNLMKRLQAAHGLTYLVISHDLSVVRYLADRIGVMYLGKLVEVGSSQRHLRARRPIPYTLGLLDTIPVPDPAIASADDAGPRSRASCRRRVNPPSGCRFRTRCPLAQDICAEQEPPLRPFGGRPPGGLPLPAATPVALPPRAAAGRAATGAAAGHRASHADRRR